MNSILSELPQANLPTSICTIRIVSPNRVLGVPSSAFLIPDIPGATTYSDTPCLTFLIESHDTGTGAQPRRLIFDLGIPKNLGVMHPTIQQAVHDLGIDIETPLDMTSILAQDGIPPDSVESVILSHHHFDHVGDLGQFPASSTSLIVGPGFKDQFTPGFPDRPDNTSLPQQALQDRQIIELDFSAPQAVRIAGLWALDWLGNGSLWLLDTPGHAVGHISALIRTTIADNASEKDTWIFLAGDVCHHAGELRPSLHHPLPASCHACRALHRSGSDVDPFYEPAPGPWHLDPALLIETTHHVQSLDADPDVFVVLSHDHWLEGIIDLFPKSANAWKSKGWDDQTRWGFLKDFDKVEIPAKA